jgi:hypothetical protein
MQNEKALVAGNSTAIYIFAFLITTFFHELAHSLVGYFLNSGAILHHNYVNHPNATLLPINHRVAISLSGPLFSLFQGIALSFFYRKSQLGSISRLFLLWLIALGYSNFFGYLMTGPFFNAGDISKIYSLLEIPLVYQAILAFFGLVMISIIAYKLTIPFLRLSHHQDWLRSPKERMNFAFIIIIIPWIIGSGIVTLLYLPAVALVSIIYPFTSGMIFIFPWRHAKRIKEPLKISHGKLALPLYRIYLFLLISILVFRLVLAPGIKL